MADVTARLVWYRARENYDSLTDSYQRFSWRRVDVLDMLFLAWVVASLAVVGLVSLCLRFFGRPKALRGGGGGLAGRAGRSDTAGSASGGSGLCDGETGRWMNSVVGWVWENFGRRQALVEAWAKSLSEEAKKYSERDIQIRFDGIQFGGSPPKLSNISTDTQDRQTLTVLANVECTDITLLVSMVTMTATHMQTTGCQIRISRLSGPMRIQWKSQESPDNLHLSFHSKPEINLHISPNNYGGNMDPSLIRSVILKIVSKVVLHLPFPSDSRALETISQTISDRRPQHDLRLLVKLIKANGLMDEDFTSCDPYCTISVNEPPQQHSTSVVKNTVNPFFDEYFLIDTNRHTKQVTFEVYDQSKPKGDGLLGHASIGFEDLRHMANRRQIIPLTGYPQVSSTTTSGSVTAEFLFVDSSESSWGRLTELKQSPPRRRIERNRSLMPEGVTVTTQTTTTERLREQQEISLKRNDQIAANGMNNVTGTALRQLSHHPDVPSQSATIGITRVQKVAKAPNMKPNANTSSPSAAEDILVEAKKKSFSSALKRCFTRSRKSRSLSADQTFHENIT